MPDDFENSSLSRFSLFTTSGEDDVPATVTREEFDASQECVDLLQVYELSLIHI